MSRLYEPQVIARWDAMLRSIKDQPTRELLLLLYEEILQLEHKPHDRHQADRVLAETLGMTEVDLKRLIDSLIDRGVLDRTYTLRGKEIEQYIACEANRE